MITFSKLGKLGRFGNQLFQIALAHTLAKKYDVDWMTPEWKYAKYFQTEFPQGDCPTPTKILKEPAYNYHRIPIENWNWWAHDQTVDLEGYFQSTKHWKSEEDIKQLFKFKPGYVDAVIAKYPELFGPDAKPSIAVGVRRTDYVGKLAGNYHVLSPAYYINALQKFDYEKFNIIFISDDLDWCKFNFASLENAHFPAFDSDMDQFIAGSLCSNFIIANSTFHWWSAFLGKAGNGGRVIQPTKLFDGKLLAKEGDVNFYKSEWEFQEDVPVDLTDTTFTLPVRRDHNDRKENLDLTVTLLNKSFKTNIIIGEQFGDRFKYFEQWCKYIKFEYPHFHRTKMLNEMAKAATTPYIVNFDCDVMVTPCQIWQSVEKLRKNEADVVYPYEWLFVRIKRPFRQAIFPSYDLSVFARNTTGSDTPQNPSVGGAVFFNKEAFLEAGGENENCVSYSPEDRERFERFTKLGYRIARIKGQLYHFDHWIGPDSSTANPFYKQGAEEYAKIRTLTPPQLLEYIKTWPWTKDNPYNEYYYDDITSNTEQSRDEVFKCFWMANIKSILDIGGGLGFWGRGLEKDYTCVDYGVPKSKLVVREDQYIDHDLRKPLNLETTYDMVMCLEVAEHLEARYAETLVKSICSHAKKQILFSAAFPGQGGTGHVNEQWGDYWIEKFEKEGWYPSGNEHDLHAKLFDNKKVDIWYRNNLLFFTRDCRTYDYQKRFVHPDYYEQIMRHHGLLK